MGYFLSCIFSETFYSLLSKYIKIICFEILKRTELIIFTCPNIYSHGRSIFTRQSTACCWWRVVFQWTKEVWLQRRHVDLQTRWRVSSWHTRCGVVVHAWPAAVVLGVCVRNTTETLFQLTSRVCWLPVHMVHCTETSGLIYCILTTSTVSYMLCACCGV